MNKESCQYNIGLILSALLLAAGIAVAGFFIGNTIYKARIAANTAMVKGLAERNVQADIAIWSIQFTVNGPDLGTVYKDAQEDQNKIVTFLTANGFDEKEITRGALTANKEEHRDSNTGAVINISYSIYGNVSLRTVDVNKVAKGAQKVGELVGQDVLVTGSAPSYIFTKLNEIKPDLLGEATRNARIAAEQFAKDANAKVGKIQSAMQGTFTFSPRDASGSNEYESDTGSIDKTVRVVTTITFYLED